MDKAIKRIADHYGWESQSRQLIEEMAGLTQALNKHWREEMNCGKSDFDVWEDRISMLTLQILFKIADVEVMLEQIKYLLPCGANESFLGTMKKEKIERQLERIESEGRVCE